MPMQLSKKRIQAFRSTVWNHYKKHKRDFSWRKTEDPYKILVSEIMLQQTQASRVLVKHFSFIKRFPNFKTLAKASLGDVLREWQGLGYNHRAKTLWQLAQVVITDLFQRQSYSAL